MRQNPSNVVVRPSWPLIVLAGLVLGGCSSEDSIPGTPATEDQEASGAVEETTADATRPAVTEQQPDPGDPSRPVPSSVLPHATLLADLVGDDQGRRRVAGDELAADPPAVQELVEVWRDGDPGQRRGAAFYAMGIYRGDDPQIEDRAIQSLKDPDARVRGLSLELVKRFPFSRFPPRFLFFHTFSSNFDGLNFKCTCLRAQEELVGQMVIVLECFECVLYAEQVFRAIGNTCA